MPSTNSVSNCRPLDSSTVITPSLPTFSMTSAMSSPICLSAAEMVAICAICSFWCSPSTLVDCAFISSTTATTPRSRPRLRSIGFAPAAMFFMPSWTIACARTTDVVVPSPAMSFVLVAASLRSCAPMFSKGSSSSTSRATVTPSCVTVGDPNFLSTATFRPFGPSVVFTALAIVSMPFLSFLRASSVNASCFAMRSSLGLDGAEDVFLTQDEKLLVVELEFGPGVLLKQNSVTNLELDRDPLAGVGVTIAGSDGKDTALLGLLLGGIRKDDPALCDLLAVEGLDHDAGAERLELGPYAGFCCGRYCHCLSPPFGVVFGRGEEPQTHGNRISTLRA